MSFQDIVLLFMSIYGWAWVITKSKLLSVFRKYLETKSRPISKKTINKYYKLYSHLSYLFNCIVCTSFWVAIVHIFLLSMVYPAAITKPIEYIVILGSSITFVWVLANIIGDAE